MRKWVATKEKHQFLKWFLEHHPLKRTDARVLLEHILKQHHLLENVSFIENILPNEKCLVFSSVHSDQPGFQFSYQQRSTDQVARAMAELISHPSGRLNVLLHFNGKMLNHQYTKLVGYPELENIRRFERFEKYSKEAEALFVKVTLDQDKENLKKQIDDALDQKNEQLFLHLVARLKELNSKGDISFEKI